jgi:hypothetical protein
VYIDSSRVGVLLGLSDMYISDFSQINPPITYSFSITLLPYYSTVCSALHYINFIHRCKECFNIFHSLTFSFLLLPPVVSSDRPTNIIMVFLCDHDHKCIYMYIYLTCLASTYEGKHATFEL